MAKKQKPFVRRKTIWNAIGGGFSKPGESKVTKIGKHKVLVTRSEKLDYYGNPVHSATLIKKNGSMGNSAKSNGSATLVVSECLKKNGIETRK